MQNHREQAELNVHSSNFTCFCYSQACWQRLSVDKRSKTLEAIREMQSHREQAELNECSFKPKINATSAALMADRSETLQMLHMSAHEQLFQDALRRQQK